MTARLDLYRDADNGILFGVCAGIADRFELNVVGIRVLAVVALIIWSIPTAAVYLTAAMLLKDRPLRYRGRRDEREFWRNRMHGGEQG